MYYTRQGDNGTTTLYHCDQRLSKSSAIAEALGALDETGSVLGLLAVHLAHAEMLDGKNGTTVVMDIQSHLFTIQAEIAGADKHLSAEAVLVLETYIDSMGRAMSPITTFVVAGGTELSALTDIARTVARRAERRVVGVSEEGLVAVHDQTLAYLNRLSSFLFVLARYVNKEAGVDEHAPTYDE
jgi:cob(I)alamin adenosyltransferase